MFLVFNKEKIYAYLVSFITVIFLFCIATGFNENKSAIETASQDKKLLPIYNVQTDQKKVAFTMNCAWNADDIDSILKTLKQNNVKITFFMVGDWIEKNPDAVKKIYEEGHEIASHSDTHPHVNNLSYEKNIEEIEKSNEKIEKITGKRTNIYRAPYGEYNIKPGDIILSHNGTEHTAESLNDLIKNIKQKGLEIVTVSNLIYKDNYTINANGTQIQNNV